MSESLALFVVGADAENCALTIRQAMPQWDFVATLPATGFSRLDERLVTHALEQTSAPRLAFVDAERLASDSETVAVLKRFGPGARCQILGIAGGVPMASGPRVNRATRSPYLRYPVRWATLVAPPETCTAIAFDRSEYARVGALRDIDDPLWDWLLRAVACGVDVTCSVRETGLADGPERLPSLAAVRPPASRRWLFEHLANVASAEPGADPSLIATRALKAGLYLWHDDLDESHRLVQSIEGKGRNRLGDYWHAILHRREPDFANARYWFRQIGAQPTFDELAAAAALILNHCGEPVAASWSNRLQANGRWNSLAFVDLCEAAGDRGSCGLEFAARKIQHVEMALLLDCTYEAMG